MTIYGLQWTQATDAYVRPAESVLTHLAVTSPTNAETLAAVAQASTYAPWSGMRRCNLWDDGTPTAYYGDRCYTDTDVANMGQAMVKIPKFWYCTDHGGGVYKWWISDTGMDEVPAGADGAQWKGHPAFLNRDGAACVRDQIYLGAYEAYYNVIDSKLESKAGVPPTGSKTTAVFRTAAELRAGAGTTNKWELQDYLTTSAVQLLYLVEYGKFNSQTYISAGITHAAAKQNTGYTSLLGNATGQALSTGDDYAMSYRGIENLYGNIQTLIDGLNIKADNAPWIADHDFATNYMAFGHPYIASSATPLEATGGYATDIKVDTTYDYGFLASGRSDNDVDIHDYYDAVSGNRTAAVGGTYTYAALGGAFAMNLTYNDATTSTASNGTRLMYMG